jgi:hypothetical protein
MFGFGFDRPDQAFQTRGDAARRFLDFSKHLLTAAIGQVARIFVCSSDAVQTYARGAAGR